MADKSWVALSVPSMGDVAVWVDADLMHHAPWLEVENVTQMISDPSGRLGLRKLMTHATVNMEQVVLISEPPSEIKSALSRAWDTPGQVILPNNGERKRFLKND